MSMNIPMIASLFFVWHEAYHMGQVGTVRTKLGLTPSAVLAR